MQEKIKNLIKEALKNLGIEVESILLEHPVDLKMGDYSSNIAMALAKKLKTNPKELAEKIVEEINKNLTPNPLLKGEGGIQKVESAGAGFINFYLNKSFFKDSVKEILENKDFGKNNLFSGKKVMVEYTQPNPFKPFHIGHLMSNAIGESISRLVEFSGAKTVRANYQGDVGLHVGKAIYGLMQKGSPALELSISAQAEYIGTCYSWASNLYDTDEKIKKEIDVINKKVYNKSDTVINDLYAWGREITLRAFEEIYKTLGTEFDYYFFESEMAPIGQKIVLENMQAEGPEKSRGIFDESDGAVVFHAEKYDLSLHTRVFITSQGLPTYETKEIGLTMKKFEKENPDLSIVTTAIEQGEYMKVVRKAIEQINPSYALRMKHITHGMMRLVSGKMASRKGNVITGESLLKSSMQVVYEKIADRELDDKMKNEVARIVGVAALKYAILHQAIGGNIVYDEEKSVSFEGDSGPYLQYSYARANSILEKATSSPAFSWKREGVYSLPLLSGESRGEVEVFDLEKLLYRFPEIVLRSVGEFEPHYIANYLIDLARSFNNFYGNTKIIDKDDPSSPYKIALTEAFSIIMKKGLYLLGIESPERM